MSVMFNGKKKKIVITQGYSSRTGRTKQFLNKTLTTIRKDDLQGATEIDYIRDFGLLRHVDVPEGVITIQQNAFDGCFALTSISLPKSLKTIGADAFKDANLYRIEYSGNPTEWSAITKGQNWDGGNNPEIIYGGS